MSCFELSTAISYVIPRRKQFYVGFIGLLASLSISVIVWVILVFFSVTQRFEERWSEKIELLLGPLRIVPSESYYTSDESKIDTLPTASNNAPRRFSLIEEKPSFLWNPENDLPLPEHLIPLYESARIDAPQRSLNTLKKALAQQNLLVSSFETSVNVVNLFQGKSQQEASISQYMYTIGRAPFFLPTTSGQFLWTETSAASYLQLLAETSERVERAALKQALLLLFQNFPFSIKAIEHHSTDRTFVANFLPETLTIVIEHTSQHSHLSIQQFLKNYSIIGARAERKKDGRRVEDVPIEYIPGVGYPIYLPQQLKEHGIELFSQGTVSDKVGVSQHGIPVIVFGFFDTGVLSVGGKACVVAPKLITSLNSRLPKPSDPFSTSALAIYSSYEEPYNFSSALERTQKALASLPPPLRDYFSVETFKEYSATKELFSQLKSERNLFRLLALILLMAASTNIFSMLFILVHTKTKEIAIMRAIGMTKKSIQLIFISSGALLGLFGLLFGSLFAQATLSFLPEILRAMNAVQGHEVLQASIYGSAERTWIDPETLAFAALMTLFVSSCAGWLASLKALRVHISDALRMG